MSDQEDDFIAKARRERQIQQDQGARDLGDVSTKSLGNLTPTQTPQTRRPFPGGMPYGPSTHPTDTPATTVSESDLRQAFQRGNQPSITPESFPQHEAGLEPDSVIASRGPVNRAQQPDAPTQAPADTPAQTQKQTEQEIAQGQSASDRQQSHIEKTDQDASRSDQEPKAAPTKAPEQTKAPETPQER